MRRCFNYITSLDLDAIQLLNVLDTTLCAVAYSHVDGEVSLYDSRPELRAF